jgi:broad specificity phosphatase PhoE
MKLYIIRHAQSINNALANQMDRVCDPSLTELGYRQAEIVAQHLVNGIDPEYRLGASEEETSVRNRHDYNLTRLYCSAMYRALLTARPIGQALGLTPEVWVDIHEAGGMFLDHHDGRGKIGYPGQTRSKIVTEFPDYILPAEITAAGWWNKDFEERPACHGRAVKVATQLRQRAASDENIAMVSHGGFIDSLIKALLNQLPYPQIFYHHYNTAITRIDFRADDTLDFRHINRFDHLPWELIS